MSYRHHYHMLLPVAGMIEDTTVGLTPEKVAEALRALAAEVDSGRADLQDLLGRRGPAACEREDRWVWRAAEKPNIICKKRGGWVKVEPTMIDLEDTFTGEEAAQLLARSDIIGRAKGVFCRPEDIGGVPIIAVFTDPETGNCFLADMREFLATGPDEAVAGLAASGWSVRGPEEIIETMWESGVPGVIAILNRPGSDQDTAPERFGEITVEFADKEAATAFLREVRPDLHGRLFSAPSP